MNTDTTVVFVLICFVFVFTQHTIDFMMQLLSYFRVCYPIMSRLGMVLKLVTKSSGCTNCRLTAAAVGYTSNLVPLIVNRSQAYHKSDCEKLYIAIQYNIAVGHCKILPVTPNPFINKYCMHGDCYTVLSLHQYMFLLQNHNYTHQFITI